MSKVGTAQVIDLLKMANVTEIAVAGIATIYSQAVGLPRNTTFCFTVKADSGGVVEFKVEFESSNELPTTEEASDTNYVVPDGKADVITAQVDKLVHRHPYAPATTKFGRFKITGTGLNDASTVIDRLQISYILAI